MKKPVKKSMKTKSRVQTVTTRQILTATFALLLANGFALVTLPSKNVGIAPVANCPIRLTKSYFCQVKKGISGYRQFTYTCPSGKSVEVSGTCRTEDSVLALASKACKETKSCVAPKAAMRASIPTVSKLQNPTLVAPKAVSVQPGAFTKITAAPPAPVLPLYLDLAFIGSPESNITFEKQDSLGHIGMKIHYVNRGPAALVNSNDAQGGSKAVVTLLDAKQEPILFEPETMLPSVSAGQYSDISIPLSTEALSNISKGQAKFIKIELKVGNRVVGDTGLFDNDLSNNVQIKEIPANISF